MKPSVVVLVAVVAGAGCYTPRGAFVPVEAYQAPRDDGYLIEPGDVLQVRVFQQEPLSARVRVRSDGKVSLPLVGECLVQGRTPADMAVELQEKLKAYVNSPLVTVSLEEGRPLTISVVGEVLRPGVVTLATGAGVLHAVGAAGGLTEFAHRDGLFVLRLRSDGGRPSRIRFTWDALSQGQAQAASFSLSAGDVVVVE